MICQQCKTRFGSHYTECPSCHSKQIKQEEHVPPHYPEPDLTPEIEAITTFVEFTNLDDFGPA